MKAPKSLLLVTALLALSFGACGASEQPQEADVSSTSSALTAAEGPSSEDTSSKLPGNETTELTCDSCYVRCTAHDLSLIHI